MELQGYIVLGLQRFTVVKTNFVTAERNDFNDLESCRKLNGMKTMFHQRNCKRHR